MLRVAFFIFILATVQFEQNELVLFYENGQLTAAKWNGKMITITRWITICAMQVKQLSIAMITETIESDVKKDNAEQVSTDREYLDETVIEDWITTTVRPAYDQSEKFINDGKTKAVKENGKTVYRYEGYTKTITAAENGTYSAFYIDGHIAFILHVAQDKTLTRYYFKNNQLVKILYDDKTVEYYNSIKDRQHYLNTEAFLLDTVM